MAAKGDIGEAGKAAIVPPCDPTAPDEAYFAALIGNSPLDLFVLAVDAEGHFVFEYINPALTRSTGYTPEMLVGKRPEEVLTPANADTLLTNYRKCVQSGQRVEYDVVATTPMGELTRHTILAPITNPDGKVAKILGTSADVTALRRAEIAAAAGARELSETNERLLRERSLSELIVQNTADGIIVVDTGLRYLVWNRAMEGINGRPAREVLGRTVFEDTPGFGDHPVGHAWRKAISGERAEMRDFRFFCTARGVEVTYDADFAPLRGLDGAIVGAVCIVREITDRRRFEEMLRQSQKLEAMTHLTGGVAHEFNNLLTSVVGCLDLLMREQISARAGRLVETAQRSADHGGILIQQLLAFARRQTLHEVSADIHSLLAEIEVLLRHAVGETIEIVIEGSPDLWRCKIDRSQFEAAVMNLVINSRDAIRDGGRITLRTFNVRMEDPPFDVNIRPGEYVGLAIEDNGAGMSPEIATKAFDPFFTTKEVGKGTGLGLSIVHGFVTQLNGGISLQSSPGSGTSVTLYFPRDPLFVPERNRGNRPDEPLAGAGSVLVVEDDDVVREVSLDMLSSLGYRVLAARDGHEALDLLRGEEAVHLLFSDVVMPGGLSGEDVAREARRMRPGLPILLTTGYAGTHGAAADGFPIIAKPFRLAELSRAVANLLRQTPSEHQGSDAAAHRRSLGRGPERV
jgi:PAS domain S-box-containing protein